MNATEYLQKQCNRRKYILSYSHITLASRWAKCMGKYSGNDGAISPKMAYDIL